MTFDNTICNVSILENARTKHIFSREKIKVRFILGIINGKVAVKV